MNNTTTDTFERIAEDAVITLTAAILTLRLMGGECAELADVIAADTEEFCMRGLALAA